LTASGVFFDGVRSKIEDVHRRHSEFLDLRQQHPWLTGCLGDPFAGIWFLAEIPSLTPVTSHGVRQSPEKQWTGNNAALLFRRMIAKHGLKTGTELSDGGWCCYITNAIKYAAPAEVWKKKRREERLEVARAWAPVLAWELETAPPRLVVALGGRVHDILEDLIKRKLVPVPQRRERIDHYSYIARRADTSRRLAPRALGPMDPLRLADYDKQFDRIVRDGS